MFALNKTFNFVLLFAVIALLLAMPDLVHAEEVGGGGPDALPFEEPLEKLKASLTGPVAFAVSLIGIIAAGAVLIFGGEMSGFLRTMVFLVLVIAIIMNAGSLVTLIGGRGAEISMHVGDVANALAARIRGLG